jgi:serine phosphatase RsbU (regulator of sigma subunit)/tetratricopeptide (TPR) repeat protein
LYWLITRITISKEKFSGAQIASSIYDLQITMYDLKFLFRYNFKLKSVLVLFFLFSFSKINAQSRSDKYIIDSVFSTFNAMKEDTGKVNYFLNAYDSTIWQFNLPEAYNKLKYVAKLSIKLDYDSGLYRAYHTMAGYCSRTNNGEFAIENRMKALAIAERMNDSTKIISQWSGIGLAYQNMGKADSGLVYFFRAKPFTDRVGNRDKMARLNLFIGWSYQTLGNNKEALRYLQKSLKLRKEIKYIEGIFSSLGSIRSSYIALHDYDSAMIICREECALYIKTQGENSAAPCYNYMGEIYELMGKRDSALGCYKKSLSIFTAENNRQGLSSVYKNLASVLQAKGDSLLAFRYYKMHIALRDSLAEVESRITKARMKEIYDLESKNAEIDMKEKDIEAQKKSLIGLGLILGISCILGIIIFLGYRQKKRIALDLSIQKKVVEEKNLDITNSIVYAKRIQQAILPSIPQIKKALPDSFVLYQPKDIVSGDFFWFTETAESYYLAAVDCTGHGVPGALMSMIGYNFLSQIVNEMKTEGTATILNLLHKKILSALNKDLTTREVKDGMDIALLRIFRNKNEIEFSGAVRPLYIVENGILNLIKGDIYSIGGIKDADGESFTSHTIHVSKGTSIYLFSDGFADQFGGPHGKKFKYKNLKEFFVSNWNLPMEEQKNKLDETFRNWKGDLEQVDDVMVIGVKI